MPTKPWEKKKVANEEWVAGPTEKRWTAPQVETGTRWHEDDQIPRGPVLNQRLPYGYQTDAWINPVTAFTKEEFAVHRSKCRVGDPVTPIYWVYYSHILEETRTRKDKVAGIYRAMTEDESREYERQWPQPGTEVHDAMICFVREYMVDFDLTKAAMRYGFPHNVAARKGVQFYVTPFFQFLLRKEIEATKEQTMVSRNQVLAWLVREANSYSDDSSSATRVAALGRLTKVLGMEVLKVEVGAEIQHHHVMQVPLATATEWEQLAKQRQEQLKNSVRN